MSNDKRNEEVMLRLMQNMLIAFSDTMRPVAFSDAETQDVWMIGMRALAHVNAELVIVHSTSPDEIGRLIDAIAQDAKRIAHARYESLVAALTPLAERIKAEEN